MRPLPLIIAALSLPGLGWLALGMSPPQPVDDAAPGPTQARAAAPAQERGDAPAAPEKGQRSDSFWFYGPNGLWKTWTPAQKIGRNTWIFYAAGDQKFYRILARFAGEFGISVDFYRLLDSRTRPDRFRRLGLINEPNFVQAGEGENDEYGFHIDKWNGDPEGCYDEATGEPLGPKGEKLADPKGKRGFYPWNPRWFGEPTGIVGLRKFPNPDFTPEMKKAWLADSRASVRRYFKDPGKVEPPYIYGISCAFCHIAFNPLDPPKDPANPRWENLAANIGNQFLREGDLFFGAGKVVGGDARPGPNYKNGDGDPYDTGGLGPESFLYQYGHAQPPGTSETSRFSYDFINNPNTINQIINLAHRPLFVETAPDGRPMPTNHVLKDGADSVGIRTALLRVFVNIGSEGDYWSDHLWNPAGGKPQSPFQLREVQGFVSPHRFAELRKKYPELGDAWAESNRRADDLLSYLTAYGPYSLQGVADRDGKPYLSQDGDLLRRGSEVFVQKCARCHSSSQPSQWPQSLTDDPQAFYRQVFEDPDFRLKNTFSDDVRYPFNYEGLGINAGRAFATNAVEGDIWADLSSKDYKALRPLRTLRFVNPLNRLDPGRFGGSPIVTEFDSAGGGRGYYRTAALNSMWATAPFLHNNAIGDGPVSIDPQTGEEYLDAKYVTIEGRLELFEKAMDELLNPEKRPPKIKVTSADCGLIGALPGIRGRVADVVRDLARSRLQEFLRQAVAEAVDGLDLPELDQPLRPLLKQAVLDLLVISQPIFDQLYTPENLAKLKGFVIDSVQARIQQVIQEKLKGRPRLAELVREIQPKFEKALREKMATLADVIPRDLVIPKGTPLNLILNLHVARAPYALKFYLKNKADERLVAEELLRLSDCPDLVENRGHTYGSELKPADKRALIEFLKTL